MLVATGEGISGKRERSENTRGDSDAAMNLAPEVASERAKTSTTKRSRWLALFVAERRLKDTR